MTKRRSYLFGILAMLLVLSSCTKDSGIFDDGEHCGAEGGETRAVVLDNEESSAGLPIGSLSSGTPRNDGTDPVDDGDGITDDEDDEDDDDDRSAKSKRSK
jgi:hypothetical protein